MKETPNRFPSLDGLRGLASLSVVFSHSFGIVPNQRIDWLRSTPLWTPFDGAPAVTLFFVLSGFVLTLPYAAGKPLKFGPFYIRRLFRLYPAYWFAIGLSLCLMPLFRPSNLAGLSEWVRGFWMNPVPTREILKTLLMAGPGYDTRLIDPPIWSLMIEMSVSLLLPPCIFAMGRQRSWPALVGMILFSYVFGHWVWLRFASLFLFLLGGSLALHWRTIVVWTNTRHAPTRWLFLLSSIACYGYRSLLPGLIPDSASEIVSGIGSAGLIVAALAFPRFVAFLSGSIPQFLGRISYSLYLLHFPVLLMTAAWVYPTLGLSCTWITVISVSALLSAFVYHYLEIPTQTLGRRLARTRRKGIA
jgi:peptidoglycan/LPS O-acetylase OafA/YrhL